MSIVNFDPSKWTIGEWPGQNGTHGTALPLQVAPTNNNLLRCNCHGLTARHCTRCRGARAGPCCSPPSGIAPGYTNVWASEVGLIHLSLLGAGASGTLIGCTTIGTLENCPVARALPTLRPHFIRFHAILFDAPQISRSAGALIIERQWHSLRRA